MVGFKVGGETNVCPRARTIVWFTCRCRRCCIGECSGDNGRRCGRRCGRRLCFIGECSGGNGSTTCKNENLLGNHIYTLFRVTPVALAGKVVSFDCKYVSDDGGLGRHFLFR